MSEVILLYIIYAVFCETFHTGVDAGPEEFVILLVILVPLHLALMSLAFYAPQTSLVAFSKPDIVALLFCCTEKTVAMGIPLLTAVYEDNENLGIYSVPLLIYHPMQLVIGSLLIQRIYAFATSDRPSGSGLDGNQSSGGQTVLLGPKPEGNVEEKVGDNAL